MIDDANYIDLKNMFNQMKSLLPILRKEKGIPDNVSIELSSSFSFSIDDEEQKYALCRASQETKDSEVEFEHWEVTDDEYLDHNLEMLKQEKNKSNNLLKLNNNEIKS